jgi:lipoyl(octanoyl) transferase
MVELQWLGRIDYGAALEQQRTLVQERSQTPDLPDTLLLLEHPHTFTLGRRGDMAHLLVDEATLAAENISVHRINRGGDITYHGPGQLVGYPILNLKRLYAASGQSTPDVHDYVRRIEETLMRTLAKFDIHGRRYPGFSGVWVERPDGLEKIAAVGIGVNPQGISSHGFALNVTTDLAYFDKIIPCGISDHGVTSMAAVAPTAPDLTDLIWPLTTAFEQVFATPITNKLTAEMLTRSKETR